MAAQPGITHPQDVSGWVHALIIFNYFVVGYGQQAVVVFIVLSGYCLMLPVVRTPNMALRGGTMGFLRRRARRILPAYYAALALGVGLLWVLPPAAPPALGSVLTHVLLVHNWSQWIFDLNPALWSIAVEWQIYFVFVLVLAPCCRRFGLGWGVALALGLGLLPLIWLRLSAQPTVAVPAVQTSPWLVGCFGIGMLAARLSLGQRGVSGWKTGALALGAVAVLLHFHGRISALHFLEAVPRWLGDYVVAGAAACLIVHYAQASLRGAGPSLGLQLLQARPVVALGMFSYSLYLTHLTILEPIGRMFAASGLSAVALVGLGISSGILATLGFAYLFYRVFERPFVKAGPSR